MYDVIFKNGNVVDVKNEQILQADIAVKDGKIAGIGHFSGENVIDCTGKYITPGFIDAHVHWISCTGSYRKFCYRNFRSTSCNYASVVISRHFPEES